MYGKIIAIILFAVLLAACSPSGSNEPQTITGFPEWQMLDSSSFANWTGARIDGEHAVVGLPGHMIFRYPDGPKGWIKHGFRTANDGTADWHTARGLSLDMHLPDGNAVQIDAYLGMPGNRTNLRWSMVIPRFKVLVGMASPSPGPLSLSTRQTPPFYKISKNFTSA
jgi:hypothetical protein